MDEKIKKFILGHKDQLILFQLLNSEEVDMALPFFDLLQFKKGETVFNEGDKGDYVGVIMQGHLEVKKQTDFKGRQVIIAALKEGSFVGEMSLVNEKEPRSATVSASEDSELIALTRASMNSLIEQHPSIGAKILQGLNQVLAIRLRKAVERLASIF